MKNEKIFLSLSHSFTGEAAPPNPLGLKALSDFRGAKVPGTAGRLMAAC